MEATNEAVRDVYDKVTIRLHWATALLVAILWVIGTTTPFLPRGPLRVDIWSCHVVLGFALASVMLARIVWRGAYGRSLPPADSGVTQLLATATHMLLYVLLVIVVALGSANVFAHGFPLFNVWRFPKLGNDFVRTVNAWHRFAAHAIAAVALLHTAAALFHRYVIKDAVLARMWPDSRAAAALGSVDRAP